MKSRKDSWLKKNSNEVIVYRPQRSSYWHNSYMNIIQRSVLMKRGLNSLDFSYRLGRGMQRYTEYSVSSPSASLVVVLMVRPRARASNTTSLASGLGTSHRVWFKQKKTYRF